MSAPIPIVPRIIGGTVMLSCASLFGYFSLSMLRNSYKRTTQGTATTGVITGFQDKLGARGSSRQYFPEVEFQTPNGEKISFVSSFGSSARPKIGRNVKVLYYSENPKDAAIASFFKLWIFPLPFLLGALVFLLGSLTFFSGGTLAK